MRRDRPTLKSPMNQRWREREKLSQTEAAAKRPRRRGVCGTNSWRPRDHEDEEFVELLAPECSGVSLSGRVGPVTSVCESLWGSFRSLDHQLSYQRCKDRENFDQHDTWGQEGVGDLGHFPSERSPPETVPEQLWQIWPSGGNPDLISHHGMQPWHLGHAADRAPGQHHGGQAHHSQLQLTVCSLWKGWGNQLQICFPTTFGTWGARLSSISFPPLLTAILKGQQLSPSFLQPQTGSPGRICTFHKEPWVALSDTASGLFWATSKLLHNRRQRPKRFGVGKWGVGQPTWTIQRIEIKGHNISLGSTLSPASDSMQPGEENPGPQEQEKPSLAW